MSEQFLVATRKGLFTVQRGERRLSPWSITATAFLGDNVSMVLTDPRDGAIWAALDHGHFGAKLHVSRDGGNTWTEATSPAYPPKPEGHEEVEPAGGRLIPWTVLRIWALEPGGEDDPGGLWAVRFRAGSSAPTIEALRGSWCGRSGTTPSGASGLAVAPNTRASTRSASSRGTAVG